MWCNYESIKHILLSSDKGLWRTLCAGYIGLNIPTYCFSSKTKSIVAMSVCPITGYYTPTGELYERDYAQYTHYIVSKKRPTNHPNPDNSVVQIVIPFVPCRDNPRKYKTDFYLPDSLDGWEEKLGQNTTYQREHAAMLAINTSALQYPGERVKITFKSYCILEREWIKIRTQ